MAINLPYSKYPRLLLPILIRPQNSKSHLQLWQIQQQLGRRLRSLNSQLSRGAYRLQRNPRVCSAVLIEHCLFGLHAAGTRTSFLCRAWLVQERQCDFRGFIRISSGLATVPSPSSCRPGGGLLNHCVVGDVVSGKIVCVVDDRSKRVA